MDFNMNDKVRVRLTDYGRQALARQHVEFWARAGVTKPCPHRPPEEDADGWSEWQLHGLMCDLGHLCSMGFPTPFEMKIQLVERKPLTPPQEDPMNAMLDMQELSLRPYHGRLFLVKTAKEYEKAHLKLFKTQDVLKCAQEGRFVGGEGKDGMWTYLIWGNQQHNLAHEVSHVVLHVFERCRIDPREGNGEPFCYMLSQLLLEAQT